MQPVSSVTQCEREGSGGRKQGWTMDKDIVIVVPTENAPYKALQALRQLDDQGSPRSTRMSAPSSKRAPTS